MVIISEGINLELYGSPTKMHHVQTTGSSFIVEFNNATVNIAVDVRKEKEALNS